MSEKTTNSQGLRKNGFKDGRRRYKDGLFPVYHEVYTRLEARSSLLNEQLRQNSFVGSVAFHDADACRSTLRELTGITDSGSDRKGYYRDRYGNWVKGLLIVAKENLAQTHRAFKEYQSQQIQNGNALLPPEEWPEPLIEKRLKHEAALDIRLREKHVTEQHLQKHLERQKKEAQERLLPKGPLGEVTEKSGDRITEIDGQSVLYTADGIPYIDCESSPYDQMPLFFYKQMAKAWVDENLLSTTAQRQKRYNDHAQRVKEAKAAGKPIPKIKVQSKYTVPTLPKSEWPRWPKDAKPIKEIK